ncbi:MAG: Stress response protein nst1 [Candelina submexicana]|nr:MAG: Stress response protein nst1 [Candelina submexicana]
MPPRRRGTTEPSTFDTTTTATYSNKDGSKFIKVQKASGKTTPEELGEGSSEFTRASPANMAPGTKNSSAANGGHIGASNTAGPSTLASNGTETGGVNRKKQKRRQKQAARLAAEHSLSNECTSEDGVNASSQNHSQMQHRQPEAAQQALVYGDPDFDYAEQFESAEGDDQDYVDEEGRVYRNPYAPAHAAANGYNASNFKPMPVPSKKSKKKKSNEPSYPQQGLNWNLPPHPSTSRDSIPLPPPPPPLSTAALRSAQTMSKDRIWNTSTQEERERIKDFWLSLGEEERRSLVKVEKEAVLRKMKEQQKHSCSCTVCGRKRTAIEEELEVLYDAYYEELEQYANHQQIRIEDGAPMMPPPRRFPHPMARLPSDSIPPLMSARQPSRARIQELADDEEDGDDEDYSGNDDDEDDYSDEELEEEPRHPATDFFNFGNSLTVQSGVLTVADDLLKNDGKKFIEMMEQLAERRMQREEEAQYAASGLAHPSTAMHHSHATQNHGPAPDEEEYDDEEDEEYDSQEDEEYDDDEMDTMTEEQRMEEGRRMFQIFAARMFEQRVLTAYREKVALERQQKLIEELDDEDQITKQREAKKAKEAQKKKDKKRLQKQAKEEEKAKKEAEKAAEEAAARAVEEKKLEEQRLRKEEQRKKKEAEKKAQEEEKFKKEAEKQKRLQEERDRQAEAERKQREQKERERKRREELKKKEREEREAKEKAAKERKEQEEKEKREKDAKAKIEREAKDRAKKEEQAANNAAHTSHPTTTLVPKRLPQPASVPIPNLNVPIPPSGSKSPHVQIATPVIPKAPTPARPRQTSQHGSHASSPKTPQILTGLGQTSSPVIPAAQQSGSNPVASLGKTHNQQANVQHPQPSPPILPSVGHPPATQFAPHSGFPSMHSIGMNGIASGPGPVMSAISHRGPLGHEGPIYHPQPAPIGYRPFPNPNGMPFPPGMNPMRPPPQGRGHYSDVPPGLSQNLPSQMGPPSSAAHFGVQRDTMPTHSHSRHQSASTENPGFEIPSLASQPIGRPAPIQRPSSVTPQQRQEGNRPNTKIDIENLSSQLGSSALLDDSDEPLPTGVPGSRRGSAAPGPPRTGRHGFGAPPLFTDPIGSSKMEGFGLGSQGAVGNTWGTPQSPFGPPGMSGNLGWSNATGTGWSSNNAFGVIGGPQHRSTPPRPVAIRLMICQVCKQLTGSNKHGNGFHDVNIVLRQIDQIRPANEAPVQMREMLEICETEGDSQNGGGYFVIKNEGSNGMTVRHELDTPDGRGGMPLGEIGSPLPSNTMPAFSGSRPFQPLGGIGGIGSPSGF